MIRRIDWRAEQLTKQAGFSLLLRIIPLRSILVSDGTRTLGSRCRLRRRLLVHICDGSSPSPGQRKDMHRNRMQVKASYENNRACPIGGSECSIQKTCGIDNSNVRVKVCGKDNPAHLRVTASKSHLLKVWQEQAETKRNKEIDRCDPNSGTTRCSTRC
jgi:hypothetical protein